MSPFPNSSSPIVLRPYKFQIIAVCQIVDGDNVLGERNVSGPGEQPIVVFGIEGLRQFAESFEAKLAAAGEVPDPQLNGAP